MLDGIVPFATGFVFGMAAISPGEWAVHKHLLHAPARKRNLINYKTTYSHHDVHHAAYRSPEHYYRDVTNEHEVIHFGKKYVLLIEAGMGVLGLLTNRVLDHATSVDPEFDRRDGAYMAGFLVAGIVGYVGYELTHHYMHVVGERRLGINRRFGDMVQGGVRDGRLRYSKPALDALCNAVEAYVDEYIDAPLPDRFEFDGSLVGKLRSQTEENRRFPEDARPHLVGGDLDGILQEVTRETILHDREMLASLSKRERRRYERSRRRQLHYRGGGSFFPRFFQRIDNHHMGHHIRPDKNLNVFTTWADRLFGTSLDTSVEELDRNRIYWQCPNSPDRTPFKRRELRRPPFLLPGVPNPRA